MTTWNWDGPVWDYDKENEAPWLMDDEKNPVLKGTITCRSQEEANLIASAPDLLEALLDASHFIYGEYYFDHPTVVKVRAAIEKATGK